MGVCCENCSDICFYKNEFELDDQFKSENSKIIPGNVSIESSNKKSQLKDSSASISSSIGSLVGKYIPSPPPRSQLLSNSSYYKFLSTVDVPNLSIIDASICTNSEVIVHSEKIPDEAILTLDECIILLDGMHTIQPDKTRGNFSRKASFQSFGHEKMKEAEIDLSNDLTYPNDPTDPIDVPKTDYMSCVRNISAEVLAVACEYNVFSLAPVASCHELLSKETKNVCGVSSVNI